MTRARAHTHTSTLSASVLIRPSAPSAIAWALTCDAGAPGPLCGHVPSSETRMVVRSWSWATRTHLQQLRVDDGGAVLGLLRDAAFRHEEHAVHDLVVVDGALQHRTCAQTRARPHSASTSRARPSRSPTVLQHVQEGLHAFATHREARVGAHGGQLVEAPGVDQRVLDGPCAADLSSAGAPGARARAYPPPANAPFRLRLAHAFDAFLRISATSLDSRRRIRLRPPPRQNSTCDGSATGRSSRGQRRRKRSHPVRP